MKLKTFTSGLFALALFVMSAVPAAAQMKLYYNPDNGNLKLQNITNSPLGFQSVDILTLGNGNVGPVSGLPGNVGYLSTGSANLPAFAFPVNNFSTTQPSNGQYSQAGGASVLTASSAPVFSLNAYPGWAIGSEIGPAGTYWDFGNIAVTGMSQAEINQRFLTDPELDPTGVSQFGRFLVSYASSATTGPYSVTTPMDIVRLTPVPEPSTYAMAFAGLASCGFSLWRRRKSA